MILSQRKKKSRRFQGGPGYTETTGGGGFYQQAFWFLTGALFVVTVMTILNRQPDPVPGALQSSTQGQLQAADKHAALRAQADVQGQPASVDALPPPEAPHLDTPSPEVADKIMMIKNKAWNSLSFRSDPKTQQANWKTFYVRPSHAQFGKALESRGWTAVHDQGSAEIVWLQKKKEMKWGEIKPWQRVNHFKDESQVAHKGHMLEHLRRTNSAAQKYLPQSFALWLPEDRVGLRKAIEADLAAHRDEWWVLKEPGRDGGKGVKFAKDAAKLLEEVDAHSKEIAQRYVDNPLLLDGKKFDLRVYWAVVTSRYEPLVLYHPGSLRVSITPYNAADGPVGQLLTNAAQQGKGGHSTDIDEASRQPLTALWSLLESHPRRGSWGKAAANPREYLECEMRRAITMVFQAFAEKAFTTGDAADTFALLGADFMLDQNLNIYLSEMQSGPGLPHNTKAVKDVMDVMIPGLASIVLHVRDAHMRGKTELPLPLPATNFDVILSGSTPHLPDFCGTAR